MDNKLSLFDSLLIVFLLCFVALVLSSCSQSEVQNVNKQIHEKNDKHTSPLAKVTYDIPGMDNIPSDEFVPGHTLEQVGNIEQYVKEFAVWETYTSESDGFSFVYPATYFTNQNISDSGDIRESKVSLTTEDGGVESRGMGGVHTDYVNVSYGGVDIEACVSELRDQLRPSNRYSEENPELYTLEETKISSKVAYLYKRNSRGNVPHIYRMYISASDKSCLVFESSAPHGLVDLIYKSVEIE